MTILHLDFETYSSVPLSKAGMYKYFESVDFEILLCAYSIDDSEVKVIDLATYGTSCEEWLRLKSLLKDLNVLKVAHNAAFERNALRAYGINTDPSEWFCTAVKSAYHGLPLSLGEVSSALELGAHGKDPKGKALIKFFCEPCKPTKTNGMKSRNLPEDYPIKWEAFKEYCRRDVIAEKAIKFALNHTEIPETERALYALDQKINDKGVRIDTTLAVQAVKADSLFKSQAKAEAKAITNLENPASPAQLKKWLSEQLAINVTTLAKDTIDDLSAQADGKVLRVIELWQDMSKTSVKKYDAMLACVGDCGHARGLFQFYGAMRTGRWAGRIVQLQNLKRNKSEHLDEARALLREGHIDALTLLYDDAPDMLSQLIRTALIPEEGCVWGVMDFSSIEARVLAWLAGERWRLEVFESHGKIYEASAAAMFGVPIESVTKGSRLRDMGKVAELALGYQGGVGALKTMGGESMGLAEAEMDRIVKLWRHSSPAVVEFWSKLNHAAIAAVKNRTSVRLKNAGLLFEYSCDALRIHLPSGRMLMYHNASIYPNRFGSEAVRYKGIDDKKRWTWIDTYGGKLAENITQAVARDVLADKMLALDRAGYDIRMHVHDEVVINLPKFTASDHLDNIASIMSERVPWAKGLPLSADGYLTEYYKKD